MTGFHDVVLLIKSLIYSVLASISGLPGQRFEYFGRRLGWRQRRRGKPARQLLVNPVSSVRFFEFDFVERHLPDKPNPKILDVSSPVLFSYYLCEDRLCDYLYINPDKRELELIEEQIGSVRVKGTYHREVLDARKLPWADKTFDVVLSISVLEHIPENGDSIAIQEMWRVLKPGGLLLITFPISTHFEEETRSEDVYNLGLSEVKNNFFFQRVYDGRAIALRLVDQLPACREQAVQVYGERVPGFFRAYEKRWVELGLKETAKDSLTMATNMSLFETMNQLPGIGVAGLSLEKAIEHRS